MNYPEDIRQYDNDPRSPFYDAPVCPVCGEEDCVCDTEVCEECGSNFEDCTCSN